MGAQTKAPASAGGTLFLVAVLIVGAGFFYGISKKNPKEDRSAVVFELIFEPEKRVLPVEVTITVGSKPPMHDKVRTMPWSITISLGRGETAQLMATQTVSAKLACSANGNVQESTDRPGSVICIHTRGGV